MIKPIVLVNSDLLADYLLISTAHIPITWSGLAKYMCLRYILNRTAYHLQDEGGLPDTKQIKLWTRAFARKRSNLISSYE